MKRLYCICISFTQTNVKKESLAKERKCSFVWDIIQFITLPSFSHVFYSKRNVWKFFLGKKANFCLTMQLPRNEFNLHFNLYLRKVSFMMRNIVTKSPKTLPESAICLINKMLFRSIVRHL